jgi:CO/xanthine dehydrogenase Mo-binding subunit
MFRNKNVVGVSTTRVDALGKVLGKAAFPADLSKRGMLYAKILRSPHAHARIKKLDISAAEKLPGVHAVITARDVPGQNAQGVVFADMPVLAEIQVCSVNTAVAAVAAETEEIASEALKLVKVEYEPLSAVFDPVDAMQKEAPLVHPERKTNVLYHLPIRKGNVKRAFEQAAVVVEDTYRTQMVDHAFLQPEAALAYLDQRGHMVVHVATQYVHWDRVEIARVLGFKESQVQVVSTAVGGAFGGREDMTLQPIVALLALKTRRPVKAVLKRKESFFAHSKRHPMIMEYKTGVDSEGRLVAIKAKIIGDTGAYASWAPNVLRKAAIHATGPYRCPNVEVDAYAVYTNNPFAGAMRGFGAAQPPVAMESQMDRMAEKLGIHPFTIRWRNALEVGDTTATGQVLTSSVGLKETLRQAASAVGWVIDERTGEVRCNG